jgi:hypothetical protein
VEDVDVGELYSGEVVLARVAGRNTYQRVRLTILLGIITKQTHIIFILSVRRCHPVQLQYSLFKSAIPKHPGLAVDCQEDL